MSDDLISREFLLECAEYDNDGRLIIPYRYVKNAPTAFDKEKVIEELEYDKEISAKYSTGLREQGHIEAFDEAISIVKKGGIHKKNILTNIYKSDII